MANSSYRYSPSHTLAGRLAESLTIPLVRTAGAAMQFYDVKSTYAAKKGKEMRERLACGETVYLVGVGPSGHNSTAALVEVSAKNGIRPVCNNEEERYTGVRHDDSFPKNSLTEIINVLDRNGKKPSDILAVLGSWDYLRGISTSVRVAMEEAPVSFLLARKAASPQMNPWHFVEALSAPRRLKPIFKSNKRIPVIGMRHHDNHAYFPFAVSPFAQSKDPTMVVVIDGFGDDGAMSTYIARNGKIEQTRRYPHIFDSLGFLYAVISSTQGGWTTLSSEGRFMGASAWGDTNRLTNPYYKILRHLVYLGPGGSIAVNRSLINYHRHGQVKPYSRELIDIIGDPIPPEKMWNPDAVLNISDNEHAEVTQARVDKAAALQMVFEDALLHIVDDLIRRTGSNQLVFSGGTSLNCVANMHLLDHFNEAYYKRHLKKNTRLHLWIPPNPSDTGTGMGACYHFAMRFGAPLGPPLKHAFLCGCGPAEIQIKQAVAESSDTENLILGNIFKQDDQDNIAHLIANIISHDGMIGLFQGNSETGPRALGHRSILANPCNPDTLTILNETVKYRERFRPLAPMLTLEEAKRLYNLSDGASDDHYNAYNYMVLTVKAKPIAHRLIPAAVHRDGTSRLQIVRRDTDPFSHAVLKALGQRSGVEVAINTSLNVGTPIVQTPQQAVTALHRSRGLTGLLMISDNGTAYLVWHTINKFPKDGGKKLMQWVKEWQEQEMECVC